MSKILYVFMSKILYVFMSKSFMSLCLKIFMSLCRLLQGYLVNLQAKRQKCNLSWMTT